MGFDGLFFARIDYQDKYKRLRSKTAEFIWEGSPNLGKQIILGLYIIYNQSPIRRRVIRQY